MDKLRLCLTLMLVSVFLNVGELEAAPVEPSEPDSVAVELLVKHLKWLGGRDAIVALQTLKLHGSLRASGLRGSISTLLRRDGYCRTDYDLGVVKGAQAVTPEDTWKLNASGQVEDLGRDEAQQLRRELERAFLEPLFDGSLPFHQIASEQKDGRDWAVLRFEYPNQDSWDLFLDPEDGSSEWSRLTVDMKTSWLHSTDYKTVAGVRIAFRSEKTSTDPGDSTLVEWSDVKAGVELPSSSFARPPARKIARITSGAACTPWMKTVSKDRRSLRLRGEINGRAADILLDSGAGITVVSQALAKELKLQSQGSLTAEGASASSEAALVGGITLRIGELELEGITAATIDLSAINRQLPRPLEVILGKELFHAMLVDVDYPLSQVRFCDPSRFEYTGSGRKVPIIPAQDGHKLIEVTIENLEPTLVDVDTGSNATLDIFSAYTDENGLLEDRDRVSESMSAGVGGSSVNKISSLRSLTVGGYELKDVPVGFFEGEKGSFHTRRIAGNLGAGVLTRFRILFDYPHQMLWLEPGAEWDRPFERNRSGLQMTPDGKAMRVVFVAPGSPAAAAGWEAGARIVAIDGKKVNPRDPSSTDWRHRPAGTRVRLETDDAKLHELVLADYY